MSNWVGQRRGTKHMWIETWPLLRNIILVSKFFSWNFLYKIYQSNTISMLRYSVMLNNMMRKIWNMVSGETLSWVDWLSRWLVNCSGIGSQSMYDFHWSITQDHPDPNFKLIQWLWLSLESGFLTKPDSLGSLNPPDHAGIHGQHWTACRTLLGQLLMIRNGCYKKKENKN